MDQVALITMPWSSVRTTSLSLGILKRALRRKRIKSMSYYLNLRLAKRMSLNLYETLASSGLVGEWLFARHLYGDLDTGEVRNSYQTILAHNREDTGTMLRSIKIDYEQIAREIIPPFLRECLETIPWQQYAVIGFSSVFSQHLASLVLAREIKTLHPQVKIVFGGANVEGEMGEETLRVFDWIDYVVDGEAEENFPHLVRSILNAEPLPNIPGVSYRSRDGVRYHNGRAPMISLNKVPIPVYTEYFEQLKASGLQDRVSPFLMFESARGCWWGEKSHCTFCGLNAQGMKFRTKSPRRLIRELLFQSRTYRALKFQASDNILDMRAFKNLLPELARHNINFEIFYELKANLKKEHLSLLKAAGVTMVQPGIESLHSELLKLMKKGVTAIQNIQLLKWLTMERFRVYWNILYGLPGEKPDYYRQTCDRSLLISHLYPPDRVLRIELERYSPYHFASADHGISDIRPEPLYHYIYPEERLDLKKVAYHFRFNFDSQYGDPDSYIANVHKVAKLWKKLAVTGSATLELRKGPDFIEITDTRPNSPDCVPQRRKIVITGLRAKVYEFCEPNRHFKEILDYLCNGNGNGQTPREEEVRNALDELVADRLMFSEDNRYLSLALPPA